MSEKCKVSQPKAKKPEGHCTDHSPVGPVTVTLLVPVPISAFWTCSEFCRHMVLECSAQNESPHLRQGKWGLRHTIGFCSCQACSLFWVLLVSRLPLEASGKGREELVLWGDGSVWQLLLQQAEVSLCPQRLVDTESSTFLPSKNCQLLGSLPLSSIKH